MMLLMMLHPRMAEIVFEVIVANLTRWVSLVVHLISPPRGTAPKYKLYGYVPLRREWFSSSLGWDRVQKSESFGLIFRKRNKPTLRDLHSADLRQGREFC